MTAVEAPRRATAWSAPGFRRLATAWVFTNLGDSALFLMAAVWVKDLTGSDVAGAFVFVSLGLPALLAPFLGMLADRVPRKRLLVISNAALAPILLCLLFAAADRVWIVYVVIFVYSAGGYLTGAAQSGIVRSMLRDDQLASGNGALSTIDNALRLLSPIVGTALYVWVGPQAVVGLTAACFVVTALILMGLPVADRAPERTTPERSGVRGYLRELGAGFEQLFRVRPLRLLTIAVVIAFGATGILNIAVFAVLDGMGADAAVLGLIMPLQGAGAVLGGVLSAMAVNRWGEGRTAAVGLTLAAIGTGPLLSNSSVARRGGHVHHGHRHPARGRRVRHPASARHAGRAAGTGVRRRQRGVQPPADRRLDRGRGPARGRRLPHPARVHDRRHAGRCRRRALRPPREPPRDPREPIPSGARRTGPSADRGGLAGRGAAAGALAQAIRRQTLRGLERCDVARFGVVEDASQGVADLRDPLHDLGAGAEALRLEVEVDEHRLRSRRSPVRRGCRVRRVARRPCARRAGCWRGRTRTSSSSSMTASVRMPPMPAGTKTSAWTKCSSPGWTHAAPSSAARSRLAGFTSVTVRSAPSASRTARRLPTWPMPEIVMRRPATSAEPVTRSSVARSDSYTPRLVGPAGSPGRPRRRGADDVVGALADHEHVLGGRADILRGAIEAAERLDGVAEVEERRAAPLGVQHGPLGEAQHGLAAARVETCRRVLQGHGRRQGWKSPRASLQCG